MPVAVRLKGELEVEAAGASAGGDGGDGMRCCGRVLP